MKDMPIDKVRNFALVGHTGSGKTLLVDALLHRMGVTDRMGDPGAGTSNADWTDEEKARKISVWTKPFDGRIRTAGGETLRLVALDTPGYADFIGQMLAATTVADAAMIVVDAVAGIQVGTTRAWRQCEKLGLPRAIVINGIDKENADVPGVVAAVQQIWGARCRPVTVPAADRKSVSDLLAAGAAVEAAAPLIEAAAETDDALLEKYLGGESLAPADVARGLRAAVRSASLVPVFAVSAKTGAGVAEWIENLGRLFPAPAERPGRDTEGKDVNPSPSAPFAGFVWRTITDPFIGQLSLVRVYGGTLKPEGELLNLTRGSKERLGPMVFLNGKKQDPVVEAHAGDIVAIPKLKTTKLNDSLAMGAGAAQFAPVQFPNPVVAFAVTPKTEGDDAKLMTGMQRAAEDDPTVHIERHAETHELVLSGMGDVQLAIAVENMKKNSRVEVNLATPKVAYKETITGRGEGHYKHKKQTGGRGQYAEVYLRVDHLPEGDPEWFVNDVVGGTIPHNFIPAVQKGLEEGMQAGPQAGARVVNVRVSVYDGSYHEVDSSEIAFKIASIRALRDAIGKAKPVLLEPIMKVTIMVPDTAMGDVTGDLNHRRGRILGMGAEEGMQVITAEAPQAEMFNYSSQLRSMTGGRGSFEMEFSRMDTVPSNVAQKIIAEAAKHRKEEE